MILKNYYILNKGVGTIIGALIPIKDHSQRVPGKNFRRLGNKLLYFHILDTLESMKDINHIYIDTDVPDKFDKSKFSKKIRIINRPNELRGDMVSVNTLIEYDLQFIKEPIILQTHVTNPFLKKETINSCIQVFNDGGYDSLFTVTIHQNRFWFKGKPVNHNVNILQRTQDLEPVYEENSLLYLFSKEFFLKNKSRIDLKSYRFPLYPSKETIDIDTFFDWKIAEFFAINE